MKNLLFRTLVIFTLFAIAGCSVPPAPLPVTELDDPDPVETISPPASAEPTEVGKTDETNQIQDEMISIAQSDRPRLPAAAAAQDDLPQLVNGNSTFALDLYQALRAQPGNLFYSPYSISLALAMTSAGARGDTEAEMADVLHFTLPQAQLHPAFNSLDLQLNQQMEGEEQPFELNIANSIWGQQDFTFEPAFLDVLAENYGAGLRLVDYVSAPEAARQQINTWVEDETQDKIKDLIPPGAFDPLTRLVLANAIYFKAAWQIQFEEFATKDEPFTLLDGSQVTVPTMHQTEGMLFASGDGWQAVELPYAGGRQSMLVLLPAQGQFEAIEANLDANFVAEIVEAMQWQQVDLAFPKFSLETEYELDRLLASMGMSLAFDANRADFSGMTDEGDLYISAIIHKAFVDVNEEGTEAAAATAVIMRLESAPADPVKVQVDRPFVFFIRDIETGSILFTGRVMNPLN